MKGKTNLIVSLLTLLSFVLSVDSPAFAAAPSPLWEDLSPHEDFPVEWWYMTGFLKTEKGRRLGFQATFFRMENKKEKPASQPSSRGPWAPSEIFGFHGAVSDLDKKTFVSTERDRRGFSRSVLAQSSPFSVRVGRNRLDHPTPASPSLSLSFRVENQSFSLRLSPQSPPVWHDKDKKFFTGPNPTDWAYYYSYPLVVVSGTRTVANPDGSLRTERVHGQCWFDHEWMVHTLNKNQIGWIWLWAWNKTNTQGIMLYQMLDRGGGLSTFHRATVMEKEGANWKITRSRDVFMTGGKTGRCLSLDRIAFEIGQSQIVQIHPEIERQLLGGTVSYWEGASKVDLGKIGAPDQGRGYLEVTGLDRWENGKLCRSSPRK
ncbi:MAG: lipocalin-like domain-containing protein [Leptospirillia bacterium]